MINGFKEFIAQGNALELAVAVIIGGAFKPIVGSITTVINFLLIVVAVYFAIVLPMNTIKERMAKQKAEEEAKEVTDVELLTEIRDLLATKR